MKNKKLMAVLISACVTVSGTLNAVAFAENYIMGDVNGDSKVDSSDSSLLLMQYSKISTGMQNDWSDVQNAAGDVNFDGLIDSTDASMILRFYSYSSTGGNASPYDYFHQPYDYEETTQPAETTPVTTQPVVVTTSVVVPQAIVLKEKTVNMIADETYYPYISVIPGNAENKTVIISSSDNNIAVAASDGMILARSAGTAVITVQCVGNTDVSAQITVNVSVPTTTTVPTTAQPQTTTTSRQDLYNKYINEVGCLVNEARSQSGLPPLKMSPYLIDIGNLRAKEISVNFNHTRPDGSSFDTIIDSFAHPYYFLAENIAAGSATPSDVMSSWHESSGHWASIMSSQTTHMGIGVIYTGTGYGWYWSQVFMQAAGGTMEGEYYPSR